jgi:cell division protein FtsW
MGLVILASASQSVQAGSILQRQVLWLIIALVMGVVAATINLERLREWSPWLLGIAYVLLVAVLIPHIGVKVNGARRWINLGPMNFQVTDIVKVISVFWFADWLGNHQRKLESVIHGYLIPIAVLGSLFLLILLQPDYGTAFLIALVGFSLLFLAGVRLRFLIPTVLLGIVFLAVMIAHNPVRLARITTFMNLEAHKSDTGYQLTQGIIAFGNGGAQGVGLGNGRQQWAYMPEAHTDFIFPIIGEELGLPFTLGVLFTFALFITIVILEARRAPNLFFYTLAIGSALMITYQALLNVGVVTGILPTKGISLPFISYGGSNLVATFMFVGILLNCFRTWQLPRIEHPVEI